MLPYLIQNIKIVNEGKEFTGSIIIKDEKIEKIIQGTDKTRNLSSFQVIDGTNKILLPGVIDDQVHFRDYELAYKGDFYTESKAAVAGGVTSFMDMPNTKPQTTTLQKLEEKFQKASQTALANYSFYLGATNDNISEVTNVDPKLTCGIKVFMGSSTGNMLVDDTSSLENIFSKSKILVATHCEDESIIQSNLKFYKSKYGVSMPFSYHPIIRNEDACYTSSKKAFDLAKKFGTRLHVLHISTAKELELFQSDIPSEQKQITSEVCVHHLWFDDSQYDTMGSRIKWNPAVKTAKDKSGLLEGLKNGNLDIVATDHAPHSIDEKNNPYFSAPSGGPMVQHSLPVMLEFVHNKKISLTFVAEKMCHAPAKIFNISKRGFIREGYYADLVIADLHQPWEVEKNNILYKCGWSPLEKQVLNSKITHTFVNGRLVYDNGHFNESIKGQQLRFDR